MVLLPKGYMLIVMICKMHAVASNYVQNILTVTYGVRWFKIYNNPITQCWMHMSIWFHMLFGLPWICTTSLFWYWGLPLWLVFMYPDSNLTVCTILDEMALLVWGVPHMACWVSIEHPYKPSYICISNTHSQVIMRYL